MQADEHGDRQVAHAGCVYQDEPDGQVHAMWEPGEGSALPWQ